MRKEGGKGCGGGASGVAHSVELMVTVSVHSLRDGRARDVSVG